MKVVRMVVATAGLLFAVGTAQALPMASAPTLSGPDAALVQVRGGCGFGAHRGPYGGCRLNRGPRGQVRRMITGAPGGCPPGLYRTPRGFCRR